MLGAILLTHDAGADAAGAADEAAHAGRKAQPVDAWHCRIATGASCGAHHASRFVVFAASGATLAVTLALAPLLGSEFLPKLDEGNIWLTITLPPSSALEQTKARRARGARDPADLSGSGQRHLTQVGRPDDGTDPKGAEQPGNPGRPEAARQLALPGQGEPGRRHVREDPPPAGRADQLLPGDRGQRRGSAVRRERRDRRQDLRPRPRRARPEKRAGGRDTVGHPRRGRRRRDPHRRPERARHRDRPRAHRAATASMSPT